MDGHGPDQMTVFDEPAFWPGIGNRTREELMADQMDALAKRMGLDPDAWLDNELAGIQKDFEDFAETKGFVAQDTHLWKLIVALRKRANGDWRT